jgi:CHAT domain-containing protein/tetratricopeptide (TPR) repeat protein
MPWKTLLVAAGLSAAALETPASVRALVEQGRALRLAGHFAQALSALEAARLEARRVEDVVGGARATNELGRLRVLQGELEKARGCYEEALASCEAAGDRPCQATAILGLGSLSVAKGDVVGAGEHARRGLAVAEDVGDGALAATALVQLGWVQQDQGDYAQAAELYDQALGAAEHAGDRAQIAVALGAFGRLYRLQGETDLSLQYLRRSVALLQEIGDKPAVASASNHIGIAHSLRGEFAEAMRHFQQSLAVAEELGQPSGIADGLNNVGIVHRRQGDLDLALDYFRRSLAVRESMGDTLGIAGSNNNIALAYMNQGNHAQALVHYEKALALARERGSKDEMAGALSNMGVNHRLQGAYPQALERYRQALALREELGDKGGIANVSRSIAIVYSLQGDHAAALEHAERAVTMARETGLREVLTDALTTAGTSHLALGRPQRAREALEEAIAIVEEMRRQVAGGDGQQQRILEMHISPYVRMVDLLVAQGDVAAALGYAERGKGRVLLDVLLSGRTDVVKRMTDEEREQERRLASALVALNNQLSREERRPRPDRERVDGLKAQRDAARRARDDFASRLYVAHPGLRVDRGDPPAFRLEEAAALLPDARTALVEYAVTDSGLHLFVVDRPRADAAPRVRVRTVAVSRQALRDRVQALRTSMAERDLEIRPAARRLYDLVLAPARGELKDKSHLIVVPDDALWDVPFQALVTTAGRYLIEEHAVSYAPSLTVLREMAARRRQASGEPRLLALGNPTLGARVADSAPSRDAPLAPLPEAEREVRKLADLYGRGRSTVLIGDAAREEDFKSQAGGFSVLHLATHGLLDSASPMHSRLVLAPGGDKEDGLLEAWELLNLDLRADLVVLSACETGRGRVTAGEGVIGLSWALFVAGSPTAVVSQWKVDSASTSDLMLEFHRGLRRDPPASRAAALRSAALRLLRTRYAHPFYWAGFIVVGDAS